MPPGPLLPVFDFRPLVGFRDLPKPPRVRNPRGCAPAALPRRSSRPPPSTAPSIAKIARKIPSGSVSSSGILIQNCQRSIPPSIPLRHFYFGIRVLMRVKIFSITRKRIFSAINMQITPPKKIQRYVLRICLVLISKFDISSLDWMSRFNVSNPDVQILVEYSTPTHIARETATYRM